MTMSKIGSSYVLVLFFILLTNIVARSQEIRSIDSLVNLCVQNDFINGDILITVDNKPFYKRTVGYRDNAKKEKLTPNSIFNIGSVSKPFTSIAIMQLQEKKLLNVNDKVEKYLPQFPYKNICIKHLLSHTSGIIENLFLDDVDKQKLLTNDSLVSLLNKYKPELQFEPGDKWSYSNLGYDILAVVVEQASKMKFDVYIQKNVFQPAGMYRTFVSRSTDIKQWLPKGLTQRDIAIPHSLENIASCSVTKIDLSGSNGKEYFYFYGSTNVYTTVYDLIKFDKALSTGKILSYESQELAYTPYKLNNGNFAVDSLAPILSYYGLGWDISIDTSYGRIIWHKGRSGGTRTVFLRNPSRKLTVAFSDNNDNANSDLKAIAFLKIINHQAYRDPIYKSLVQKFGCDISTLGFEPAYEKFVERKEHQKEKYYLSKDEMVDLSIFLSNKNNLKDALVVSKIASELYPDYWWLSINYGNLLLKNGEIEPAKLQYQNAALHFGKDEKDHVALLESIGSQFIDAGRFGDAEIVLKLNIDLFPKDCNSYDNYAFILDKNNKLDLAITVQQKAVDLAVEQHDTLLNTFKENLARLKAKK